MMNTKLSAFTLIELLIVITIIAVLASIALPAFTGVKERADQTKDLSNAKQIALALRQFAIDNNGSYPAKAPAADYSEAPATQPPTSNDAFWWLDSHLSAKRGDFCHFRLGLYPSESRQQTRCGRCGRRGPIRSNSAKTRTRMSL